MVHHVQDPFSTPTTYGSKTMQVNGLQCVLHMPQAVKSRFNALGDEIDQPLPPYADCEAFSVADFDQHCPEDWIRGNSNAASYFVPVKPEHGLWLDFRGNRQHPYDVAVVVSAQGLNALTGQKSGLVLEQ